jgi:hypothetical protein
MKKFTVVGLISASKTIGTYEAETKEEAIEMAMDDNGNHYISLCHQCSREVDIGYDLISTEYESFED